ncbi:polyprenol reductase 2 isoform X1 [Arachis duranensis]|uniref:Polyprenol reductase 2 isoform X1 n=1 Tax=Arachis duranensis TaxID=130453 RepID=A0A9C6WLI0_ARADU|nr:polyprenol reductase 2 isoform X1 [Arachis duranensis]
MKMNNSHGSFNQRDCSDIVLQSCSRENYSVMELEMHMVLPQLLRLAWIAGTLPILIASIPIPKLNFLHTILLGFARRGKIMHSSSQKFTLPQRFFLHFYIVASIWTTFLLVTTWCYAYTMVPPVRESSAYSTITSYLIGGSALGTGSTTMLQRHAVWQAVFLLLLMEAQVLRRLFETIYVFKYSPSARMHVLGYLTGMFFYLAAPLSLCADCALDVFYFLVNLVTKFIVIGKDHMPAVEVELWQVVNPLFRLGWRHWIGATVFFWGWIHQQRCHKILGSLRNSRQAEEYAIPHGDWFEIVSSPHYLSEMVIYGSFVVATGWSNLTIWLLLVFVLANLSFAAVETHRWYHQKFEDYPSSRFAVIPYIL